MRKINTHYFYKPELIGENPLIVEVGLWSLENIGFVNTQHPNCRLRGFEADPDNFEMLERNNNLPNMRIFNKALSSEHGKATMYKYKYPAWHSMYPKHHFDGRELVGEVEVDCVTLADIAKEPIDLLMLNCEGCELSAFKEIIINENVRKNIKQISTSFHDGKCYDRQFKDYYLLAMADLFEVHKNTDNEVPYYLFINREL